MRKFTKWLTNLSLTQQLLFIIMSSVFVFGFLFFVYLRGNIQDVAYQQTYNILHRAQDEVMVLYQRGIRTFEAFNGVDPDLTHVIVEEGKVKSSIGGSHWKSNADDLCQLVLQENNESLDGVVHYQDMHFFYTQNKIDDVTTIISYMDANYTLSLESSLLNSVSNLAAIVVGALYILLIVWVSSLLSPLNHIRTYIEKVRNGEECELSIDRNDEIGEVAYALKNMREELKKQDEIKEEMIHNISHDLKTPIATIKSYAESIKDGIYPYDTLEKSVDVIIQNADRLEKKVHSLLFLNRLDYLLASNEQTVEDIDMKNVVEMVMLALMAIKPEIKIHTVLSETTFRGEEESWRILVENLMDNALRYALTTVTVELNEGYLAITNDGPTLSVERKERLFKPFEKGSNGKFGLGLSICYKVCTAYGYSIEAINLENGVCFAVKDKKVKKEKKKILHDDTTELSIVKVKKKKTN